MRKTSPLDSITRKPVYLLLLINLRLFLGIAYLYSRMFARRKKPEKIRSIAAVWYWPPDYPAASKTRLGMWKTYFEKEGIRFDNFHVNKMSEVVGEFESGTWTQTYFFYLKTLWRRFPQFLQMRHYDVVWIDRWFLPYYPLKQAIFEAEIQRMCGYLVMDSTDGTDYQGYPDIINDAFSRADRITVAYSGLVDFYEPKYPGKIFRFNYPIIEEGYLIKQNFLIQGVPVLGWMGSPDNFKYLKSIEAELVELSKRVAFQMIIICRIPVELNIPGVTISYHRYGNDYFELLSKFDIGLSPYTVNDFGTTGKIGMKHQEFLLCQIPQVCSPAGISEHAKHEENCLIVPGTTGWANALEKLLSDESLRQKLAESGRAMCLKHYTLSGQWPAAKKALSEF